MSIIQTSRDLISRTRSPVITKMTPITTPILDRKGDNVSLTMAAIIYFYRNYIFPRRYVELPEELWIEIFIRLPVKSLLQVMYACKHWYFLIKDPSFRHKHLQFQKTVSKKNGHLLLLHHHQKACVINHFLFDGATRSSLAYHNILRLSVGKVWSPFDIYGPINGLYCLHDDKGHIVIWNPATNEVGFLPPAQQCIPADPDTERYLCCSVVGFGTDPLDEEHFKVILIPNICSTDLNDESVCGMLYTTRTNTWRLLNDVVMVVSSLNNTYLNGFYYWMKRGCKCTCIVFDMSEKEDDFREISTPCHGDLALHDDQINLFSLNNQFNEVDIWVMLEESDIKWSKKVTVRGIQDLVVKPLGFWKMEHEILLVIKGPKEEYYHNAQTILYNISTRETKYLGPRGYKHGFKACVYYESFVTLSGGITKYKGNDFVSFVDMVLDFFLKESPQF